MATTFVEQLSALVRKEREADVKETEELLRAYSPDELQKRGVALINLKVAAMRTGLGAKYLVDLESGNPNQPLLPPHKLRNGDIVSIQGAVASTKKQAGKGKGAGAEDGDAESSKPATGTVYRVLEAKITVVVEDELPDDLQQKCRITRLANEITYQRLVATLERLKKTIDTSAQSLTRVLMGQQDPSFTGNATLAPGGFRNSGLNDAQKNAVMFAMQANDICLIHGPPGTGKTYTLVEVVQQLVAKGERVLVCGPSNISVDNLVERLAKCKIPLIRLGHPARVLPTVLSHCLDIVVRTCSEGQIVADVVREIDAKLASISKCRNGAERRQIYRDVKELRRELRAREANVVTNVIKQSRVVLCTLNGAATGHLNKEEFDTVIIDECTQAIEPECWTALMKARKAVLAGDHLQLPPTVKAVDKTQMETVKYRTLQECFNKPNLTYTLFDRLLLMYKDSIKRLLNVQYRMHKDIMTFSSKELYDDKLVADASVAEHRLTDLEHITDTDETGQVLMLIDTAGCDMTESADESRLDTDSKYNEGEAGIVRDYVLKLINDGGMRPDEIAVITPYNAQVGLLNRMLKETYPALEIGSVDGFQGREKEAIVLSLVRSNEQREIGFLRENRRLNVAITRAKRHLCVVCDSDTVSNSKFCKDLVEYLGERGETRFPGYE